MKNFKEKIKEICLIDSNWREPCNKNCEWYHEGITCPNSINKDKYNFLIKQICHDFLTEILPEEIGEDIFNDDGSDLYKGSKKGFNDCREETKSRASEIINKL